MRSSIERFLHVAQSDQLPPDTRLHELAEALDQLAWAYHRVPKTTPDDGPDAPDADYYALRVCAGRNFPELGFYRHCDPLDVDGADPLMVGDGIDDLADIGRDLLKVRWLLDQGRFEEAAWVFRFEYQSHWGYHLHDLRGYLHRVIYD